ncbi:hypothetical protein EYC80_001323 [Monilinia laxa]|uniref:Uncharacterized protein n=1 Tax=Monilinia laxa TaxID=61186 RepID=A0A5N6K8V8_MONLA|nr:hypothetical protein EYC80_001323 [Monilinia laxa]
MYGSSFTFTDGWVNKMPSTFKKHQKVVHQRKRLPKELLLLFYTRNTATYFIWIFYLLVLDFPVLKIISSSFLKR